MHAPEVVAAAIGVIVGYQAGSRTILHRLGRVERRARQRSLGGK